MIGLEAAKVGLMVDERANGGETVVTVLFFFSVSIVLTGVITAEDFSGAATATGTGAKTGDEVTTTGGAADYLTGVGTTAGCCKS